MIQAFESYKTFLSEMNNIFVKDQKYSFSIYKAIAVIDNLITDMNELLLLSDVEVNNELKNIKSNLGTIEICIKVKCEMNQDYILVVFKDEIILQNILDTNYTRAIKVS